MQGNTHTFRRPAALTAAVAAMLLSIPLASAGQVGSQSSCQSNQTYAQAVRAGQLPAIVAALHGGAATGSVVLTSC